MYFIIIIGDIVLNVIPMRRIGTLLGNQVTIVEVKNAVHDVFLSKESVREKAFERMFAWLKRVEESYEQ